MPFPPLARELADDATYRRYLYTTPRLTYKAPLSWRVTILGFDNVWRYEDHDEYSDALRSYVDMSTAAIDVALTCRRQMFEMPLALAHLLKRVRSTMWCPACRRPSSFQRADHHDHYGLHKMSPNKLRCFYCGIQRDYALEYQ